MSDALASGGALITAGAGYGKTTLLEQVVGDDAAPAWIRCSPTERAPETLLKRILDAVAKAAPGASEALSERLAAAPEQVDALAATREFLVELPKLMVEPVTLVIDDAEHLEGADDAVRLVSELLREEVATLHVAVASRRPLALRVAKPLATGQLLELGASDLAFDAEECEALMRTLGEGEPAPGDVEAVIEATEGWPLGVTFAVQALKGIRRQGGAAELRELRSAPDMRAYLSEEVLDSLEPELREAAIRSSVTRVVTAEVAAALELPAGFGGRIEGAGMLVRHLDEVGAGAVAYHPLLRELLSERLEEEVPEKERRRLHAAVAPVLAASGQQIEAIEQWIAAASWPQAVAALEEQGPVLVRSSAGLLRRWLQLMPADIRALPTIRSLEGQLEWRAGDHPRAAEIFREALRGFGDQPNPPAEWYTRFALIDSLFAIGGLDETAEVVRGWDQPDAEGAGVLAAATAMYASVAYATDGRIEDSNRLAAAALEHPEAALLGPAEALRLGFIDTPAGHLDRPLERMEEAIAELERFDPFNRVLYFRATLALMHAERGQTEEALALWAGVRGGAGGGGGPLLADTTYAWSAVLLTQQGRLREAEAELAQYQGVEKSWRTCIGELGHACVASLRGDAAETVTWAERALEKVTAAGPTVFVHRTVAELVPALGTVGRGDRAREILDQIWARIDATYPGAQGRFFRARLIALRAWLRHLDGDVEGADADLQLFWEEAGDALPDTIRREWRRLRDPVWDALERGALDPPATIEAISTAFPQGLELVAFLDHPVAEVRRAALDPATRSGDPQALARVTGLQQDPNADLAAAAAQAAERLARTLPPLRFRLLGSFGVGRGAWRADDAWARPVDARLVRYLLVNLDRPVPEDLIFTALWPDLSPANARKSLQVAASRARRVLDPPGAKRSVLESVERSYRLVLSERDLVDVEEFSTAADAALNESGERRAHLLGRARSLWTGEPLPEERYSDWATAYRERVTDAYVAVLAALVELHSGAGDHAEAAEAARDLVDLDPLNEGGHRALIAAYARAGRTGQALRQYLECRRALVNELGIEPSEATSRLQARVLAGEQI